MVTLCHHGHFGLTWIPAFERVKKSKLQAPGRLRSVMQAKELVKNLQYRFFHTLLRGKDAAVRSLISRI